MILNWLVRGKRLIFQLSDSPCLCIRVSWITIIMKASFTSCFFLARNHTTSVESIVKAHQSHHPHIPVNHQPRSSNRFSATCNPVESRKWEENRNDKLEPIRQWTLQFEPSWIYNLWMRFNMMSQLQFLLCFHSQDQHVQQFAIQLLLRYNSLDELLYGIGKHKKWTWEILFSAQCSISEQNGEK